MSIDKGKDKAEQILSYHEDRALSKFLEKAHKIDFLDKVQINFQRSTKTPLSSIMKKRVDSHYRAKIAVPFSYKNEQSYKAKIQFKERIQRIQSGLDQVDYFTRQDGKILFKGKTIDEEPMKNFHAHPLYPLTKFSYKNFVNGYFDRLTNDVAEMAFPLRRHTKTQQSQENPLGWNQRARRRFKTQSHQSSPDIDSRPGFSLHVLKVPIINKMPSTLKKAESTEKRKRSSTKNSEILIRTPNTNSKQSSITTEQINDMLNQSSILERLVSLSANPGAPKNSLRIYQTQFRKMFTQRYGKDRITGYLCLEYIQDYDSIQNVLSKLLKVSNDEILYLLFITLDNNKDLLISGDDMIDFMPYLKDNHFLQEDYYRLSTYIRKHKGQRDPDSNSQLFAAQLNYSTFKTYKQDTKKSRIRNPKINNLRKELFINSDAERQRKLYEESDDQQRLIQEKRRMSVQSPSPQDCPYYFAINFDTFRKIFKNNRPMFYYDLLYVLGGLRFSNLRYPEQQHPLPD